jgi:REP element-mobilizing transposase RayT
MISSLGLLFCLIPLSCCSNNLNPGQLTLITNLYTFAPMPSSKKAAQLHFDRPGFRPEKSEHGGSIKNPQKRRRPIAIKNTMHLVLRSSQARKERSFRRHQGAIDRILKSFAKKYHVELLSSANVGNHLHLHIRPDSRKSYQAFIRAITAAIMMRVTGFSRWQKKPEGFQFWDQRPYSRIISTWREFLSLKRYVQVNKWEGSGVSRSVARYFTQMGLLAPDSG